MKTLAADRAVSAERALNTAIVNADITRGYEEYLADLVSFGRYFVSNPDLPKRIRLGLR